MDTNKKVGFAVTTIIDNPKEVILGKTLTVLVWYPSIQNKHLILSRSDYHAGREKNKNSIFKAVISDRSLGGGYRGLE